jgi:hypothetical protein
MKKLLLLGIAALFLATGTAHAETALMSDEAWCRRHQGYYFDRCMREREEERFRVKQRLWACGDMRIPVARTTDENVEGMFWGSNLFRFSNNQLYRWEGTFGYVPCARLREKNT